MLMSKSSSDMQTPSFQHDCGRARNQKIQCTGRVDLILSPHRQCFEWTVSSSRQPSRWSKLRYVLRWTSLIFTCVMKITVLMYIIRLHLWACKERFAAPSLIPWLATLVLLHTSHQGIQNWRRRHERPEEDEHGYNHVKHFRGDKENQSFLIYSGVWK